MQKVIPSHLMSKLNELGSLALKVSEYRAQGEALVKEIVSTGRQEGFTDREIHDLILQALKNKGISERTSFRMIPQELKDPNKVKGGKEHNKNKAPEQPEQQEPQEQPPQTTEEKQDDDQPQYRAQPPKSEAGKAAQKEFEGELLEENFALQKKVKELEKQVSELKQNSLQAVAGETIKVRIPKKMFARLFASLKNNVLYVELTANAQTGEVFELEQVKQ